MKSSISILMKYQSSILVYFILSILFVGCSSEKNINREKPNIIIVITDDQGYGDLAAHGNPYIKTPNMDKLYSESIRLTDFHVAPMCTPTRGALLTGLDAFRNGAVFVTQGKSEIHSSIPTMADVFAANGYSTGHFGKWHLGDNYPYRPQDRGFEETIHHGAWGITSMVDYWSNDYYDDTYNHNGEYESYKGFCTDVWFNEAIKWMNKKQESEKPFFVYLPTNVPHVPLIVNNEYIDPYRKDVPLNVAAFYGMITQCDENLGKLEEFLEEKGLRENTILVFMTDNGTDQGQDVYNAGMRGKKTSYYDGGHRVPFFIRWPAKSIEGGVDINVLTNVTDIFPTLINLCGLDKTENLSFDGMDLSDLLLKKENKLTDRKIVVSYRELVRNRSAVLWNKWRLVNNTELYNIADDPGQVKDVANQFPDILAELKNHYLIWYEEMLPLQEQKDFIHIGTENETETFLSSANWIGDYCDSYTNILSNSAKFGYWDLLVASSGRYEISLYRWDKESEFRLDSEFTRNDNNVMRDGPLIVPSLPVKGAQLTINEKQWTKNAKEGSTCVTFEVELEKGEKLELSTKLLDSNGEELCGAYFTYVKKIDEI